MKKAYACAAVAKMENVPFVYFSYNSIDFNSKKINGWVYEDGKWDQREIRFPDVVINISSPKTKKQLVIQRQLKTSTIFTSYPVGNKMKVYEKIKKGDQFVHALIPSVKLNSGEEILSLLNTNSRVVIKPFTGHHGENVIFFEQGTDGTVIITDSLSKWMSNKNELLTFVETLTDQQSYLLQPFIECKTKAGLIYDFRIHVQKNGLGEWEVNLIYPRISGNNKLISNISSGGYRGELSSFLREEFDNRASEIKELLETFGIQFSTHFDTLYEHSFDELGIDVAIDQNGKLWIFEVNWRPGAKNREFEVAKRLIPYCLYLINR
ncbi:YheC/YheD family protein [Lederbergia citrea]|uniref:YheC/YheD family endospore coat-associated protein n=1 Tax=Lederbergia citrea TaxID=2833581 RepID=UPI001BC99876|nr:YheC/YheD family protein [Lederbergia citrea]MBS4203257.1 YheC/YheD family protein [Lederbergia citrea]